MTHYHQLPQSYPRSHSVYPRSQDPYDPRILQKTLGFGADLQNDTMEKTCDCSMAPSATGPPKYIYYNEAPTLVPVPVPSPAPAAAAVPVPSTVPFPSPAPAPAAVPAPAESLDYHTVRITIPTRVPPVRQWRWDLIELTLRVLNVVFPLIVLMLGFKLEDHTVSRGMLAVNGPSAVVAILWETAELVARAVRRSARGIPVHAHVVAHLSLWVSWVIVAAFKSGYVRRWETRKVGKALQGHWIMCILINMALFALLYYEMQRARQAKNAARMAFIQKAAAYRDEAV